MPVDDLADNPTDSHHRVTARTPSRKRVSGTTPGHGATEQSPASTPEPVDPHAPNEPSVDPTSWIERAFGEPEPDEEAVARSTGPAIQLSKAALDAGNSCVQCGLCLPACPTYLETANEADSPRGRIRLMLGLHTGEVEHTPAGQLHLDRCLDCRACETACPSGVTYHRLIEDARHQLATDRHDAGELVHPLTPFQQNLFFHIFAKPGRLRLGLATARIADKIGLRKLIRKTGILDKLGTTVARMDALLPIDSKAPIWPRRMPTVTNAGGMDLMVRQFEPTGKRPVMRKVTVAFFEGCVASVMAADVHQKAIDLLRAAGADVVCPPTQQCCGAIHQHGGSHAKALELAKRNIDSFLPADGSVPDVITTCTAGDGAMLRQYAELLADDSDYAERAASFSGLVRDITELLVDLGVGDDTPALWHSVPVTAAYHDACHLAHGQGVFDAPRTLLSRVPDLKLMVLPESDVCCGAAGTYNLTQPDMAAALAERKLERFAETDADVLISGNIGCTLHLRAAADRLGRDVKILHPVELVHAAAFGRTTGTK